MIRKMALLVIAMVVLLVAVSCGTSNEIEISGFGGQTITVNTDGLSAEQIDALQSAANGESDIKQLMQSGLFSLEEMRELVDAECGSTRCEHRQRIQLWKHDDGRSKP